MILRSALRRELGNLTGVVFSTLFAIMVSTTLVRMLGRAASGTVDVSSVLPLIAFSSINFLPALIVLTLFVAILMAFTRAWRESEMVIWQASGIGLSAWIKPVLGFSLPFVVVVAAVCFFVWPWASRQSLEYQSRFEQREDVSQVSAGQFRESAGANRVFFVEALNEQQNEVRNVFVAQQNGERLIVVSSRGGLVEVRPNGDRFLVLEKGRRYDGSVASADLRIVEFERYGIRLDPKPPTRKTPPSKTLDTTDLLRDPNRRNLGELLSRISMPVSGLLLSLLAIPLASVNPRVGRSLNLVFALLIYLVYSNLNSLMEAWVIQGRIPFLLGVWPVHAAMAVVVAIFFYRKMRLRRPWIARIRARLARRRA